MKKFWRLSLLVLIAAVAGWWLWPRPKLVSFEPSSTENVARGFSYEDYGAALSTFVDSQGLVNYHRLKTERRRLDTFAAALGRLSPGATSSWRENDQIAFWINVYNALTLEAIINHYPIQPSLLKSAIFPRNSIRQIPGVWTDLQFEVLGERVTLDHIEHEVLRKQFSEPRIHMALVCAAKSCPPLRNEPYTGDQLDRQLNDQTRSFLSQSDKLRIDHTHGQLYLSPIFDWFGGDFAKSYGAGEQPRSGRTSAEKAVIKFIAAYLEPGDRAYLSTAKFKVVYLDYDWALNEQVAPKEIS
ncbi:MAG: DUF547 domain-containing protein [Acidobacteria bacterium]|nr:DUF547 domain-containing protein [Acidobacteriota bacterium]MCI0620177.1 DUF547 domain-containing protein [Acidobacteriota bacterium]